MCPHASVSKIKSNLKSFYPYYSSVCLCVHALGYNGPLASLAGHMRTRFTFLDTITQLMTSFVSSVIISINLLNVTFII